MGGGGGGLLLLVGDMLCDSAGKLQLMLIICTLTTVVHTSFFFFSQDVQILPRRHRINNELGKPMSEGDSAQHYIFVANSWHHENFLFYYLLGLRAILHFSA